MKLTKATMEKACRAAQMKPVRRERILGREVFIADGFSARPHFHYRRFGVEEGEFPWGAFCTLWFITKGEDGLEVGAPLLFDAFHDPEIERSGRQKARINAALKAASNFMKSRVPEHAGSI